MDTTLDRLGLTVNADERTLVQQARRVEKAKAKKEQARQEYLDALEALTREVKALDSIISANLAESRV